MHVGIDVVCSLFSFSLSDSHYEDSSLLSVVSDFAGLPVRFVLRYPLSLTVPQYTVTPVFPKTVVLTLSVMID